MTEKIQDKIIEIAKTYPNFKFAMDCLCPEPTLNKIRKEKITEDYIRKISNIMKTPPFFVLMHIWHKTIIDTDTFYELAEKFVENKQMEMF